MCKQAYLIVVIANEVQSISVPNVKRVIHYIYVAPVMCHSFIAAYTINDLKNPPYRVLVIHILNLISLS